LITRRQALVAASIAAAGLPMVPFTAHAQRRWPQRPVKLIVGFPAGSSPDLVTRLFTEPLSKAFGQPFTVDNKPGAGGNIGVDLVAKANDGHTFGMNINGPLSASPWLYSKLPYDPKKDIAPIALVATSPLVLVGRANANFKTGQEFVAAAKRAGGKMNYGSVGVGSGAHLMMELLKWRSGIQIEHIPYPGNPQVVTAMLGGDIDVSFMPPSIAWPQVRDGKLRMLAVSTVQRSPLYPDVPTVAESLGVPKFDANVWVGMFGPRATPPDVVRRVNEEMNKLLQLPDLRKQLADQSWLAAGGTPVAFARRISDDSAMWGGVVRITNVKLD
jgi:tripartite-type tricarboxylate transporter receptor subunit TctC